MTSNITFEKHQGKLDHKTNLVEFYGLSFKDINAAARYLKGIPPDNYQAWEYNDDAGLYIGGYFLYNRTWYSEGAFKDLQGIKE
jgi:hypothetical protein